MNILSSNSHLYLHTVQQASNGFASTFRSSNWITAMLNMVENDVLLVWLKASDDETNEKFQNTLDQLQNMWNDVNIFTDSDECTEFLNHLKDASNFLILEEIISQQIMPLIHDLPQLDQIYVFSNNNSSSSEWVKEWSKVKGVFRTNTLLSEAIEFAIKHRIRDSIAVSFISVNGNDSNLNVDQLEASFMYTQIFKEILLEMKYGDNSLRDFVTHCKNKFSSDISMNKLALFEQEYHNKSAIWWYSDPSFIYSMLNHALRTLQVDIIVKMGFFLSRLHYEIQQLHHEQFCAKNPTCFLVYRGQGLPEKDFEKLQKTKNGLFSFNSFVSTSREKDVAHIFAESNSTRPGMVGILFKMFVDTSLSSIPFADIEQFSYFQITTEKEVLFSMHTVFRIIDVKPIENNDRVYLVDLQMTSDDDEELRTLTKYITNYIGDGTGWDRLANLLLRLDHLDKAEELYNILLEQENSDSDKIHYYNQLLDIKNTQGDTVAAALYASKIAQIDKKILHADDPFFVASHNDTVMISCKTDECSGTLVFYNKSSEMDVDEILLDNHSSKIHSSNTITVDNGIKQSKASFYLQALEAFQRSLAPDQSSLSIPVDSVTEAFENMTEDSQVLWFNEKLLEIRQKYLSSNHPDLALSYHTLGNLYQTREEYTKALECHHQSLNILERTLPKSHPYLGIACYHIAWAYHNMEAYVRALLFYGNALEIYQRTLPANHPALETSYRSMASLYYDMKNYPKALEFYKKFFEIRQERLPPNDPTLATFYTNIARIHTEMAEYAEALTIYEKALAIHQETLPPNHRDLIACLNNIGSAYYNMKEYEKALVFHRKALENSQEALPPDDSALATCCHNIGTVYCHMEKYSEALSHFERALELFESSVPETDYRLENIKANIAALKQILQV